MIDPRVRAIMRLAVLAAVVAVLFLVFPAAFRFAEGAARSAMRLWWLILLVVLALWLIWAGGRRPK